MSKNLHANYGATPAPGWTIELGGAREAVRRALRSRHFSADSVYLDDVTDAVLAALSHLSCGAPAAGTSPEEQAEHFIQAAIDSAPEPLRRLGEWLSNVLDEDEWKTADRMVTGAAVSLVRAAPPPASTENPNE